MVSEAKLEFIETRIASGNKSSKIIQQFTHISIQS